MGAVTEPAADRPARLDVEQVRTMIAERFLLPPAALADGLALEDLGLDSMALAEAMVVIGERYSVAIDPRSFTQRITPLMTVRELLSGLCAALNQGVDPARNR